MHVLLCIKLFSFGKHPLSRTHTCTNPALFCSPAGMVSYRKAGDVDAKMCVVCHGSGTQVEEYNHRRLEVSLHVGLCMHMEFQISEQHDALTCSSHY